MKRTKIEVNEERRILSQMIVSTPFLSKLKGIAEPKLFKTSYATICSTWIWEFFDFTGEAPGKSIEEIYLKKRKDIPDEDDTDLIAEFLQKLSKDWASLQVSNPEYSAKNALDYFKIQSLDHLKEKLEGAVLDKNPAAGERVVAEYTRIERPEGQGINLFQDARAIQEALTRENEILYSLPGALGQMLGPICRGDFVAVMGPMKRGKSWWLWYFAYRASLVGLKALFISLEMTKDQCTRRAWQGFLGLPFKAGRVELACFEGDKDSGWEVGSRLVKKAGIPHSLEEIQKSQKKYEAACRGGEPRIEVFPTGSASLATIRELLDNLEFYEGFVPDVIIVDYADIMRPENEKLEYRHKLDSIWAGLRGMATERNVAVITGSQSGKASLDRDVKTSDVSEDIRKIAHITKLLTLNQNKKEKAAGVMRIGSEIQRDEATGSGQVVVLQGLNIGRAYLDSRFRKEVDLEEFNLGAE